MKTLTIERLSHDLRGIAYADGATWFVAGALPGEVIEVRELAKHQQRVDAEAVTVISAAAEREIPACEYYGECGGCDLQHVNHTAQIQFKQQLLLDQLARIGKVQPDAILPAILSEPWGYRRRSRIACKWSSDKKHLSIGFRERHSQKIVEVNHCAVLVPALQAILPDLRACLSRWSQPRQLGHIELLAADNGVNILLRVMALPSDADADRLREFSVSTGVTVYLQDGEKESAQFFYGGDSSLSCLPGDFVQGNAAVNHRLVDAVLDALQPAMDDKLLEAFCGLGNFTLPLSQRVRHITAVELSKDMLVRAAGMAASQQIANVSWLAGNLDQFANHKLQLPVVNKILLDPPRDGAQDFCKHVSLKGVERMVYVSCNPSTLARDAAILAERGFALQSVQLVDMFPQTSHIESLAVFVRDEALLRTMKKKKIAVEKNAIKKLKR